MRDQVFPQHHLISGSIPSWPAPKTRFLFGNCSVVIEQFYVLSSKPFVASGANHIV